MRAPSQVAGRVPAPSGPHAGEGRGVLRGSGAGRRLGGSGAPCARPDRPCSVRATAAPTPGAREQLPPSGYERGLS